MELEEFGSLGERVIGTVSDVFVGDEDMLRRLLSVALSSGHVLFEDNPGLGKTLLAKVFARATGCDWGRVQFTPDVMPADILGTKIWMANRSEFVMERGPVFTNILLADEINRAPPKTQSALLEAMEEKQVTMEGETHALQEPFFVMATQNPIEQEGTFLLPEAQLDRFTLRMSTGYQPTQDAEVEILRRRIMWHTDRPEVRISPVIDRAKFLEMRQLVEDDVYVDGQILEYVAAIIRATREHGAVEVGSSPRGGLSLLKSSRAYAAIRGRDFVIPDDVKRFAYEALSHRLILRMEYELDEKFHSNQVVDDVLSSIEVPSDFARK